MSKKGSYTEGNGEMVGAVTRRNETNLHIRGGSVLFTQDCLHTATDSKYTYIDVIIALNISDNFTARGELFIDDSSKKSNLKKIKFIFIKIFLLKILKRKKIIID